MLRKLSKKSNANKKYANNSLVLESLEPRRLLSVDLGVGIDADLMMAGETYDYSETITIGNDGVKALIYTDIDGTMAKVSLKNANALVNLVSDNPINITNARGKATVQGNVLIDSIEIQDSTLRSSLSIANTKAGDGQIDIGSIISDSSIGKISGKKMNLVDEGIDIDGIAISTIVADLENGADIIMGSDNGYAKGISISAGHIGQDSNMHIGTGMKGLSIKEWDSGSLTSDWINGISVKGDRRADLAGNMGADIHVVGTDEMLLKALKVKDTYTGNIDVNGSIGVISAINFNGNLSANGNLKSLKTRESFTGDINITGDATSMAPGNFSGNMDIAGDVRILKISNGIKLSSSNTLGSINIGGSSKIRTDGEAFVMPEGTSMYVAAETSYSLVELFGLGETEQQHIYDIQSSYFEGQGTQSAEIVEQELDSAKYTYSNNIDISGYFVDDYNNGVQGETSQILTWNINENGTFIENFSTMDAGDYSEEYSCDYVMNFDVQGNPSAGLKIAPEQIVLKEKYSYSFSSLNWSIDASNFDTGGYLNEAYDGQGDTAAGLATSSLQFYGHEMVSVPAGDYFAAKFQMNLTFKFRGEEEILDDDDDDWGDYLSRGIIDDILDDDDDEDNIAQLRGTQIYNVTFWAAPDVGIIKQIEKLSFSSSKAREGSVNTTDTITKELTAIEPIL